MKHRATMTERVFEKVRECRFFLTLMANHEQTDETEKFLFCVSAFLCSFRSVAYRLYGFVEHKHGRAAKESLKDRLAAHRDVVFLKNTGDLEVHGNGVTLWQRHLVSVSESIPDLPGTTPRHSVDWQFALYPAKNVIELCHTALLDMENVIRDARIADENVA